MNAILAHSLLLLTFRHDGSGMPQAPAGCFALLLLTVVMAMLRHGGVMEGLGHGALVLMSGLFCVPLALAYALLSAGIDALAIILVPLLGDATDVLFSLWEMAGVLALVGRYHFGRRAA